MLLGIWLAAAVGAGPDIEEKATPVELPVEKVMVFSDRARITRAGRVKWGGGVVRVPDLPGGVMLDTIHVTATGAKVVRVETHPVQRERWSIDQVDQWLTELEQIADKLALAQGKLDNVHNELALLSSLDVAPPVPEKDRLGKPVPALAPDNWRALQDHLAQRRAQERVSERALEKELRDLNTSYARARREVQKRDLGGFTDQKVELIVILESDKAEGELSVEYAMPGASWRPAYDLYFDPDKGSVELFASGLVSQATGEDWANTKLALSTAIPGLGIALPALETWTLGDDREYVPTPSAKVPPRTQRPFQPPPAKPRVAEIERDADREVLARHTQLLASMASTSTPAPAAVNLGYTKKTVFNFDDESIEGNLTTPDSANYDARITRPRPPAKPSRDEPMAEPAPPPMEAESYSSAPSVVSKTVSAIGGLFDEKKEERGPPVSTRALAVYAENIPQRQQFSDPTLPAVSAGGFDYVYEAPLATTVPSQADQLRVPLATRKYDVTTFYEATPSLATTAYLKATVKNGSKLPILAGSANIFVKRTFSGDALLATTGPGGVLELPLGADEDIRLTRTVVPSTKTQGFLFGKEDVTDYVVTVEVGNYKKKAVTIRVVDQIPKTNQEKIKVELVSASPQAVEQPSGEGLLYWHVDVPAGQTKKITFTYRITRPKDWRLTQ